MSPALIWPSKYMVLTSLKQELSHKSIQHASTNLTDLGTYNSHAPLDTCLLPYWRRTFNHIQSHYLGTSINNMFTVEIIFRWHQNILYLHPIKVLRIILGYLWPNTFYKIDEEEILYAPSRVSLATGVTASEYPMQLNTPSLPSTPEPLHELKLPEDDNKWWGGGWTMTMTMTMLTIGGFDCLTQPHHHHHHHLHLPLPSSHHPPSAQPPSILPHATMELAKWPACSTCEHKWREGG